MVDNLNMNSALTASQVQRKSNVVELITYETSTQADPDRAGLSLSGVETQFASVRSDNSRQVLLGEQEQPQEQDADQSQQIEEAANRLNELAQSIKRDLKFSVDDTSGETVITVLDGATNEVIRQIPEDRVLALRENIESLKGILFSAEI